MAGQLEPDCLVGLLCDACLRLEIDGVLDGFAQSGTPVGLHESPDRCLLRQVGFAVVPLAFSQRESQLLVEELGTDVLDTPVN